MHRYIVKVVDGKGNLVDLNVKDHSGRHAIQRATEEYGKNAVKRVTREDTGAVIYDRT